MKLSKIMALLVVFVAAGVAPSRAQIFWSNQSPAGVTDDIWSVTYANGSFSAVTNQGNLLTSTDGLTWSSQAISAGTWLVSIAYGNGMWVAVGAAGTILVSSDLKTWIHATSTTKDKLNGVYYDADTYFPTASLFIAVGDSGTILTSPDALNWTLQTSGDTGFLHGITSDPYTSAILLSGQKGALLTEASSSTTVTNFYPISSGTSQDLEAVLTIPLQSLNFYVTVAVGAHGQIIYTPGAGWEDGWYSASTPGNTVRFRGLTFGNGYFVTAGEQGTIFTSTDGANWTQRFSGDSPSTLSTATLLSAAYSSTLQRFVVTGTGGTILVSNSAPTVFANVSTRGYVSSSQTFIGGLVIEGTAPRTVLIRGDGPVLSAFGVSNPLPDPVLTVFDSSGAVVATNSGWTTSTNPTTISTSALEVGAFALPNPGNDSALLLTLQPGAYTAQITSASGGSGIALFEAYTN